LSDPGTPDWLSEIILIIQERQEDVIGSPDDTPSLEEGHAVVDANPDDPWAHLILVDAMLAAGAYQDVEAELQRTLELANNDPEVYYAAADILSYYNVNLYAVGLYVMGEHLSGEPMDDEYFGYMATAAYLGAVSPDAEEYLKNLDNEYGMHPLILDLALARYTLHNRDRMAARDQVHELYKAYPEAPEVALLDAEVNYLLGEEEVAIQQWKSLVKTDSTPPWVNLLAWDFLDKFDR